MQNSDSEPRSPGISREEELGLLIYDSAVRSLLNMPPGTAFDADRLFQDTGVRFEGERFVLAEFEDDPQCPPSPPPDADTVSNAERYRELRDMVISVLGREHRALVCNQNGRLLCLVNWRTEEKNWHGCVSELVDELNARLEKTHGFRFQCVMSQMLTGLDRLGEGRQQLEEARDYRVMLGGLPGEMVFYDGILRTVGADAGAPPPPEDRSLTRALLRGDADLAKEIFRQVLEENFVTSRPAVRFLQLRIFSAIDGFLKSLEEAARELGFPEEAAALDAAPRLLDAKGIWELEKEADRIVDEYTEIYGRHRRDEMLPYKIRGYIREAYTDPNLSVATAADRFGVTPTYATRVFKQTFGTGILSYIQQVRVEAAEQLLDADHTVKDVSAMVGFGSPETMIRIFKKREGVTPARFWSRGACDPAGCPVEEEKL